MEASNGQVLDSETPRNVQEYSDKKKYADKYDSEVKIAVAALGNEKMFKDGNGPVSSITITLS